MNARSEVKVKDAAQIPAETKIAPPKQGRKVKRRILMVSLPLILVLAGGYFWLSGGRYEGTDNANLQQARVTIAATTSGQVTKVSIDNNQHVTKGQLLFQVDPTPYRISLEQAQAALAGARLQVEESRAALAEAQAQLKSATDSVAYYQTQFDRQKALEKKGIAATSALDTAGHNLHSAEQAKVAAAQAVNRALAALGGKADIPTDQHPSVMAAIGRVDQAKYQLAQTSVHAPAAGTIYKASNFKTGAFVGAGAPLFTLVETGDTWVTANFKETQLTHIRKGQKASVSFDAFPGRSFKATVSAIGAGTGAEFSLLPAQNATGNWVKVTQRVPVYLRRDAPDPGLGLRTGMSASVSVDTKHHRSLGAIGRLVGLN
ncbi:MAG: HlyD family secretion protein [Allgaiera sp.]|jgi:membrane fusion protein (multidrug efflux system)|nr:HlyD family secretion protein [Allgaiera sp.]